MQVLEDLIVVVNSLIDIDFQLSHVCSAKLVKPLTLLACGVSDSCIGGG